MKLNQIINLHKGLTAFVVMGLMIFFDNFTIAEHYLDTVVATGSNPVSPIKTFDALGYIHKK